MVQIVGHRGYAGKYPENTLLSFEKAILAGCDKIELDVHLSKDNKIIVIHDDTVDRMTDGTGNVADLTCEELQRLSIVQEGHEVQKIPMLEEVFVLVSEMNKGKKVPCGIQIELKAKGTPELVYALVQKYGLVDTIFIMSFDIDLIIAMKALNSAITTGFLFDTLEDVEVEQENWKYVDYFCPRGKNVTEELVMLAKKEGKKVYVFHVNTKELGDQLISWGVDEIGTDYPELFIKEKSRMP